MNPHRPFRTSPGEILASLVRNRRIIIQMAKREVLGRYRGSVFGLAWSFFNPILMLIVYTFFFSVVFNARWGGTQDESRVDFAIVLFVGLIVHGLFAECINRAPQIINGNVSYVKKVVFPLEILPWVAMGSALFHAAISLMILLVAQLIIDTQLPATALFFPLVFLPFVILTMGFSWFLASTGVFVRDIGQTTGIITSVLLFVSPVFYPTSILPPSFQPIVMLNPLTLIIEESRKVLVFGQFPDFFSLAVYGVISIVVACIGFWWFQRTRKGFADVL